MKSAAGIDSGLIAEVFRSELARHGEPLCACAAFILRRLPGVARTVSQQLSDSGSRSAAHITEACTEIQNALLAELERERLNPDVPTLRALTSALGAGAVDALNTLDPRGVRDAVRSDSTTARGSNAAIPSCESPDDTAMESVERLRTIAHELRTPLQAILGWVSLLRAGQLPQQGERRALEAIERNAKLQSELLTRWLDD